MAAKFFAFFSTETGRKTTGLLTAVAFTAGTLIQHLPNTLFMDNFRELMQLYRNGFPVGVCQQTKDQLEQVKKDLRLPEWVANSISTFTILGFDVQHLGCTFYKTGALIGVPVNFSYKSPQDMDKKNILVGQKTVHWTTPEGLALESSLLLSDAAQKFALAREISLANSHLLTTHTALNGSAIALYYCLSYTLNRKGRLFAMPLTVRAVLYTVIGTVTFVVWLMLKDFTTVRQDAIADEEAGSISEEYALGALEFYTKILQRNVALRSLLGDQGAKQYTVLGNDLETIRTKHLPFFSRRERAAQRYEAMMKAKCSEPLIVTV